MGCEIHDSKRIAHREVGSARGKFSSDFSYSALTLRVVATPRLTLFGCYDWRFENKAGNHPMLKAVTCGFLLLVASILAPAQPAASAFDSASKVFRLDGGNVSYVFGVNPRGELQQLYWGGKLAATDNFKQAVPMREAASFDSSYTTTPQEYAGWGAGLFVQPALKVTFAEGNRDLVLHYDSHELTPNGVDVVLKDIKRYIFVTLALLHRPRERDPGAFGDD